MPSKIPLEHEKAIVEAYLAGATLKKAAEPFGYSLSTTKNALLRNGYDARNPKVTPET